jgi:hypothetical protein
VKLSDDLERGSSLSSFSASDPFAPPKKVLEKDDESLQPTDQAGEPSPSGGTVPPAGGSVPGDTGGTPPGETPPATGEGEQQTTEFKYVLDVTFWVNGKPRHIEGMEKLDVLPNETNPLLIFMGASAGGGEGVFLVDSTLQVSGEGSCKPKDDECAFLSLGAGSEEEFTDEDTNSYRLRIDEIRKVKVDPAGDSGASASKASRKKSKSARAAVQGTTGTRRFVMPDLADMVQVTGSDSTGGEKRR